MQQALREPATVMEPARLARSIVDVLADRKASDILLLDIHRQSIIADYFVICTGNSDRQVRALADSVMESLDLLGVDALRVEGQRDGRWVVIDYGAVLVHIFSPLDRTFYQLEELWHESATVARLQ